MANASYLLSLMAMLAILAGADKYVPNYCGLSSCPRQSHTLCKYNKYEINYKCGRVTTSGMSTYEIKRLMNRANMYRELNWNHELALSAQTWANQCTIGIDECRNVEDYMVSQSVAYTKTTGSFHTKLSELVNLEVLTPETSQMGCGAVRYNNDGQWNTTYLVCNFGTSRRRGDMIYFATK